MSIPKTTQEEQEWAYEIQVRPRSGLALKHGISIVNTPGTIDNNYQGEVGVILINHGSEPFMFNNGDKIAQLVINRVYVGNGFEVVDEFSKETDRGGKGYGSSGK
jgi:dUTP pyrophosphatase